MISHKDCDHESTSRARAKCRRQQAGGSVKEVDFSKAEKRSGGGKQPTNGQAPRDRENECDVCGVERVIAKGTDVLTGRTLYVGPKCQYMINGAEDRVELAG